MERQRDRESDREIERQRQTETENQVRQQQKQQQSDSQSARPRKREEGLKDVKIQAFEKYELIYFLPLCEMYPRQLIAPTKMAAFL